MVDLGVYKGENHCFSEFNNGDYFMNFNTNYHFFADFEEINKLFDNNFSASCLKLIS